MGDDANKSKRRRQAEGIVELIARHGLKGILDLSSQALKSKDLPWYHKSLVYLAGVCVMLGFAATIAFIASGQHAYAFRTIIALLAFLVMTMGSLLWTLSAFEKLGASRVQSRATGEEEEPPPALAPPAPTVSTGDVTGPVIGTVSGGSVTITQTTAPTTEDGGKALAPDDEAFWKSFCRYASASAMRELRYPRLRLTRREPPTLDIEQVFVPLEVRRRRGRRADRLAMRYAGAERMDETPGAPEDVPFSRLGDGPERTAPEPFNDVLAKSRGVVVLGDPGGGKTTLLRWLAVVAAGGAESLSSEVGLNERLLPLPVSVGILGKIREDREKNGERIPVLDALAEYYWGRNLGTRAGTADQLRAFLQARLTAGECLVLLDGLDEVKSSHREPIRNWLEAFAGEFPRNRFVVSSRRVGYMGFELPDGEVVALKPFGKEQIKRYVEAFSRACQCWDNDGVDDADAADQTAKQLLSALNQSRRLRGLAQNPFLLTAMALIQQAEGELPRHRVQLYDSFARCLTESWRSARRLAAEDVGHDIPYEYQEEALPILGELALRMHRDHPTGRAPRPYVVDVLAETLQAKEGVAADEARKAANEFLQRGGEDAQLFLECGADEWGFLHLTFQEFFVAAGLHANKRFEEVAFEHLLEPRWEEVIRLGVGYMALVQKRPKAARAFIERVRNARWERRPWATEVLRLQIPLAALLAAEAGDALPRPDQEAIAKEVAVWYLATPGTEFSTRALRELSSADFAGHIATPFVVALRDEKQGVRALAVVALGLLRAESGVDHVVAALNDDDTRVGQSAAMALGMLRTERALEGLVGALTNDNEFVRRQAACALALFAPRTALEVLVPFLKSEVPFVRGETAYWLGLSRLEGAVRAIVPLLKDEDPQVGARVAEGLAHSGCLAAVDPLLSVLKDGARPVRARAASALGELGGTVAIDSLLRALEDRTSEVRAMAASAIGKVGTQAVADRLLAVLGDESPYVRSSAASALGNLGSDVGVQALAGALDDPHRSVRGSAAFALGKLRAKEACDVLLEKLKDEAPFVRDGVARALGRLACGDAVAALTMALKDEAWPVRSTACHALGQLKAEEAVDSLLALLEDRHPGVRGSAARALGELKSDATVDALLATLKDRDPDVRASAAQALLNFLDETPDTA